MAELVVTKADLLPAPIKRPDDMGMRVLGDDYAGVGYPKMPMMLYDPNGIGSRGKGPWAIEEPAVRYKSAMLQGVSQTFVLTWTNTAGFLILTAASLANATLFNAGVGESGASAGNGTGVWWQQTSADTELEKGGAPVYREHTFIGTGHRVVPEGLLVRGGDPVDPQPDDPLVSTNILTDGAGSYETQALQLSGTRVGLVASVEGNNCPMYMGQLARFPGLQQVNGSEKATLSNPVQNFEDTWTRPGFFGDRDGYNKLIWQLTAGTDLQIAPIGGNELDPDGIPEVSQVFRLELLGFRVCGNVGAGCPT